MEALESSLLSMSRDAAEIDVIHSGVGPPTETDVELAETFDGILFFMWNATHLSSYHSGIWS